LDLIDTGNGPRHVSTGLSARIAPFHEIPVIDFAPMLGTDAAAKANVAAELRRAGTEVGFFYIKNHGVPAEIIRAVFETGPAFFALPLEEKMKTYVSLSTNNSGYTPMLEENVNTSSKGDLHEAYDMGPEAEDADQEAFAPNIWPDSLPAFRVAMQDYHAQMLKLGRALFSAFAIALDLPADYFAPYITRPVRAQRIVYYPSQNGVIDEAQIGIGAHSDYECFTILAQHEVAALQVLNTEGEWIAAPPIPGTFVVNIGDTMARWSNDVFASTMHRVINTTGRARYSIPFFLGVNYDTLIEALPGCVTEDRPAKYAPVIAGDYVQERLTATYGYRQTESTTGT
jgi:isopenicillin N synthase-like dioxygenase